MILKELHLKENEDENETNHSHHNNEKVDSIGDKEKDFLSENFDKGICTGGALIRLLRSHNELEKAKEKLKNKENQTKRDLGEIL